VFSYTQAESVLSGKSLRTQAFEMELKKSKVNRKRALVLYTIVLIMGAPLVRGQNTGKAGNRNGWASGDPEWMPGNGRSVPQNSPGIHGYHYHWNNTTQRDAIRHCGLPAPEIEAMRPELTGIEAAGMKTKACSCLTPYLAVATKELIAALEILKNAANAPY
jgi:hypothetical protein